MRVRIEVLQYLEGVPDAPALELAHALGRRQPAIGMALLRALRAGLVTRAVDQQDLRFYYTLTSKGRARLGYLKQMEI